MKTSIYPVLLIFALSSFTLSCNEKPKETSQENETPPVDEISVKKVIPTLDPALNPLNVYKDFTKVFADTLDIQMYELIMKPGDSIGFHGHLDHTVYVIDGGKITVYFDGTEAVEMDMKAGQGFFAGPAKDVAKNTGNTTIRLLINEIYRPRVE